MRSPITEHSLIFICGDFMVLIILTKRFMKALLMSLLETLELTMIDSKYWRALSFSLMVVLVARELYTSERCVSICGVSIF